LLCSEAKSVSGWRVRGAPCDHILNGVHHAWRASRAAASPHSQCVGDGQQGISTKLFLALVKQVKALVDPDCEATCRELLQRVPLPTTVVPADQPDVVPAEHSHSTSRYVRYGGPITYEEFLMGLMRTIVAEHQQQQSAPPSSQRSRR
jgi:hypothetical protein